MSDDVRARGLRFVACDSDNGIRVNISVPREGEPLGPGDASVHAGLEHFGLDSTDIEADVERLTALGAELLDGPTPPGPVRVGFLRAPDDVRIGLIERTPE